MPRKLRIAYLAHALRSDWNNGNAHFLRGLLRALGKLGHDVDAWEPADEWSITNLRAEPRGAESLAQFERTYPDLGIRSYHADPPNDLAQWRKRLQDREVVILHEWNPPTLAQLLLALREELGFKLLFHDTHHRASSSPESFADFGLDRFDGVLAFGEALRAIYRARFGLHRVWTLHEAADTKVFVPHVGVQKERDVVWIGNWGDGERSAEIREFLLKAVAELHRRSVAGITNQRTEATTLNSEGVGVSTTIFGVRYPEDGLEALHSASVRYGGYLPNLEAPRQYAASRLTVHIPRQQYNGAMTGIPTIRVFEALACGIPLVSAPWEDTEGLFREGDFLMVHNGVEMRQAMEDLLNDPALAAEQAQRGLETVLAHHTCRHRAEQLTLLLEEEILA